MFVQKTLWSLVCCVCVETGRKSFRRALLPLTHYFLHLGQNWSLITPPAPLDRMSFGSRTFSLLCTYPSSLLLPSSPPSPSLLVPGTARRQADNCIEGALVWLCPTLEVPSTLCPWQPPLHQSMYLPTVPPFLV